MLRCPSIHKILRNMNFFDRLTKYLNLKKKEKKLVVVVGGGVGGGGAVSECK